MAYIDKQYYDLTFVGTDIPEEDFNRLATIASLVVSGVAIQAITDEDALTDEVKMATAYEVEYLYEHGGIDAILGFADTANVNESLGDYSVSIGNSQNKENAIDGIPVSSMAILLLRKAGLMSRCLYARIDPYGDT